jgi:hypothetical protein
MKVIVLNILWWSRDRYYHWARFRIKGPLQGKNCSRRKLHASKEKGCQEKETLTVRETILRTNQKVPKSLSREAPLRGFFIDSQTLRYMEECSRAKREVVPDAQSC